MRFSRKTEYGLRAVLALAARWGQPGLPAREIARQEGIPERFLEQQVTVLTKAGIVRSQRGPSGGCRLARHPADITVLEVVEALEGPVVEASADQPYRTPSRAAVLELWRELGGCLEERLGGLTVVELLLRQEDLSAARGTMFYI